MSTVSPGNNPTSVAQRLLELARRIGVRFVFSNLGSDHPAFIEAFARFHEQGKSETMPKVVVCPHEMTALSAAHGYAMVTGGYLFGVPSSVYWVAGAYGTPHLTIIYNQTVADEPHIPFGGRGASGNGTRIGGPANWDEFTQWQWVTIKDAPPQYPF